MVPPLDLSRLPPTSSPVIATRLALFSFTDAIYAELFSARAALLDTALALKSLGARVAVASPQNTSAGVISLELIPGNTAFFEEPGTDVLRPPPSGAIVPAACGV